MLKEKESEELKKFLDAKSSNTINIGHATLGIYTSEVSSDEITYNYLIEERSLGIEIRIEDVIPDQSLCLLSDLIDAINTDAPISDEDSLNRLFTNDVLWGPNNSKHEIEVKNKRFLLTFGDVYNSDNKLGGHWKLIEFECNGKSIDIVFDCLDQLSVVLIPNAIYKICQH